MKIKETKRPCDLRQQMKRLCYSRDNLKSDKRETASKNKKLRDRNVELIENRDHWKTHSKKLDRQLQTAQEEIERERMRADRERDRADQLKAEVELVRGKKSRA